MVSRTTDSLTVSWNQSHLVSHYDVTVQPSEGDVVITEGAGQTYTADITGLSTAGGYYDITVTPYNGEHPGQSRDTHEITGISSFLSRHSHYILVVMLSTAYCKSIFNSKN